MPAHRGLRGRSVITGAAAAIVLMIGLAPAGAPPAAAYQPPGQPLGQPRCAGWSGVDRYNPPDQVMADVLTVRGFDPVTVGTQGDIDWTLDPYRHPTWTLWLHGLRWLGSLIDSEDPAQLARAVTIAQDWLADNDPRSLSQPALAGTEQRTQVLVCLSYRVGLAPWLVDALDEQAGILRAHFSGGWNHGMDESAALFAVGCLLGRPAYVDLADSRLAEMAPRIVDAQGATNEQATGYEVYVYRRIRTVDGLWGSCGRSLPAQLRARQSRMPAFIAHSVGPDGALAQLGDTEAIPPGVPAGTVVDYPLSRGATGTPPSARVAVYDAGYVFGRNRWAPFSTASFYTLRFGAKRAVHGHHDHGSLTWYARGHPILIDTGHVGYETGPRRDHVRSREAHNVLVAPGLATRNADSTLVRAATTPRVDVFEVGMPGYAGATWRRTALIVSNDMDAMVVYDRLPTRQAKTTAQHWHLPPGTTVTLGRGRADARSADGRVRTRIVQIPLPGQRLPARDTTVVTGRTTPTPLGWYAPQMYTWQKAPVVVATRREAATRQLTVVTASRATARLSTRLTRLGPDRYQLVVTLGGERLVVRIGASGWMVRV